MASNLLHTQVWRASGNIRAELLDTVLMSSLGGETKNRGVWVSPDGTNIFFTTYSSRRIERYTMTIPHDLSTLTLSENVFLGGNAGENPEALWFSNDGHKMVVSGQSGKMRVWNLGTAWSPTTRDAGIVYAIENGYVYSMQFSEDGSRAIFANQSGIIEYHFSVPFGGAYTIPRTQPGQPYDRGFAVWRERKIGVLGNGAFYRLKEDLQLPISLINNTSVQPFNAAIGCYGCFPTGTRYYYVKDYSNASRLYQYRIL